MHEVSTRRPWSASTARQLPRGAWKGLIRPTHRQTPSFWWSHRRRRNTVGRKLIEEIDDGVANEVMISDYVSGQGSLLHSGVGREALSGVLCLQGV